VNSKIADIARNLFLPNIGTAEMYAMDALRSTWEWCTNETRILKLSNRNG
jgi:hypothetical protein